MQSNLLFLLILVLVFEFNKAEEEGGIKDMGFPKKRKDGKAGLAFKGKGKANEESGREELCRKTCEDKATPTVYINPWNPSHQICACWDSEEYRDNMSKLKCEKAKVAVFAVGKETYTCSSMCKKYLNDMFGEKTFVRLRESLICEAKMMYGVTHTCFCDFKFTGENTPFMHYA